MSEHQMHEYRIYEMFYSVQGEGLHAGIPMLFLRFSDCNRSCHFCDTSRPEVNVRYLTPVAILSALKAMNPTCRRLVITGGEPFYQEGLKELCAFLLEWKYILHFETNGDLLPYPHLPWPTDNVWISVSPKEWLTHWPAYISEIKWLVGDGKELWRRALSEEVPYPLQILQPVSHPDPAVCDRNLQTALHLTKLHPNKFRLGVQLHRMIGVK